MAYPEFQFVNMEWWPDGGAVPGTKVEKEWADITDCANTVWQEA